MRTVARVFRVCALGLATLALGSCASMAEKRELADSWTDLGNAWAEKGSWDNASKAWAKALDLDPAQGVAAANLARGQLEAGKFAEALDTVEPLLRRDPDNALLLTVKAYALHRLGRDEEALTTYGRVEALNGGDRATLFNLAVLLEGSARYEEALARHMAILAEEPGNPTSSFRAAVLLARLGRHDEAASHLEAYAAGLAPDSPEQPKVAAIWEDGSAYARAIEALLPYVEKKPADARAWFLLGRIRMKAGIAADEVLDAFERAVSAGFDDAEATEALLALPEAAGIEGLADALRGNEG